MIEVTPEQIRDDFNRQCLECYTLAEQEIQNLFNEIGEENKCNQGYLYEQLRNTPYRNRFFRDYFMLGPESLVTKKGFKSTFYYNCATNSQRLGLQLISLADKLQDSISCDDF
jgi:hypothetical protein